MPRYYVTKTWHDWPEGGSCGEVIEADDPAMAEHAMLETMASYYADDGDFEPEDWDVEDSADIVPAIMKAYGDEWHTVDCFDLDEAIGNWVGAGDTEEPIAIAHSHDGDGYQFIDNGSGSDWIARGMKMPHALPLYAQKDPKQKVFYYVREFSESAKFPQVYLFPTEEAAREAMIIDAFLHALDDHKNFWISEVLDGERVAFEDVSETCTSLNIHWGGGAVDCFRLFEKEVS